MLADLGAHHSCRIGLGCAGSQQCCTIIKFHLFNSSVRIICRSTDGDIGKCGLTCRSETDIPASCSRRRNLDIGRRLVQRVTFAEIPNLLTRVHLGLLAYPMPFIFQFQQLDFYAVVAWSPSMHFGATETIIIILNLVSCGATIVLDPGVQCWLYPPEVVGGSLDVQNRHWTCGSLGGYNRRTAT